MHRGPCGQSPSCWVGDSGVPSVTFPLPPVPDRGLASKIGMTRLVRRWRPAGDYVHRRSSGAGHACMGEGGPRLPQFQFGERPSGITYFNNPTSLAGPSSPSLLPPPARWLSLGAAKTAPGSVNPCTVAGTCFATARCARSHQSQAPCRKIKPKPERPCSSDTMPQLSH